MMETNG